MQMKTNRRPLWRRLVVPGSSLRVGLRLEIDGLIERYGRRRSAMGSIAENPDSTAAVADDITYLRELVPEIRSFGSSTSFFSVWSSSACQLIPAV
jgi:hypothetical protein